MRRMKLPNGYGSVVKLSGRRRNPYMARPPVKRWNEKGQPVYDKALGYYKTWNEAYQALVAFNSDPLDYSQRSMTVSEIWSLALEEKRSRLSASSVTAYQGGYNRLQTLHKAQIRDLKLSHLQSAIDEIKGSYSAVNNALVALRMIYDYAVRYEIIVNDYSRRVRVKTINAPETGEPFTMDELRILKAHAGDPTVDMILIMCYSGYRVSAFKDIEVNAEEMYFKGGVKTAASKNRVVPIHLELVSMLDHIDRSGPSTVGRRMKKTLQALGIAPHTPHDCRHTFSWLCDQAEVNHLTKQLLLGHSRAGVTDAVYGHRTIEELRAAIESLPW